VHKSTPTPGLIKSANQHKRPFSATLLTWVVLIITSLNWLQLSMVLRQWVFLQNISHRLPVFYLAVTGLIWGLVGSFLVWGLFLGRRWAPRLMQIAAPIYAVYYWLDRLLIANPAALISRWPFATGLTILLLGSMIWVLSRPKVQQFYQITDS